MAASANQTLNCSVVFIDIVEYSKKTVEDQLRVKERLNALLVRRLLPKHRLREVSPRSLRDRRIFAGGVLGASVLGAPIVLDLSVVSLGRRRIPR
jgi:hypothetical protein